jgi:hypothetical protein
MAAIRALVLAAALGLALWPAATIAQVVPDLQDLTIQGEQINRSVQEAVRNRSGARGEDGEAIDGEAGIYVLTLNQIFQLSASGTIGYTDNPNRTADDLGGSVFSDFSLAAGVATRLGGAVDFGLSAIVAGREYYEAPEPSSRTVSANMSLGLPVVGPVYAGAVAFGGWSFDRGFENGNGFYGLSGNLSAAIPLTDKLVVRPGVGATRQWSEISENDSSSVAASLDLFYAARPDVTVSLRGTVGRRWYDDFYEDVTFVARRDTLFGVSGAIAWRPAANVTMAVTASYENQDSRFFLAEFDALEAALALSAFIRF